MIAMKGGPGAAGDEAAFAALADRTPGLVDNEAIPGFQPADLLRDTRVIGIDLDGELELGPRVERVKVNGRFSSRQCSCSIAISVACPGTNSKPCGFSTLRRRTWWVTAEMERIRTA